MKRSGLRSTDYFFFSRPASARGTTRYSHLCAIFISRPLGSGFVLTLPARSTQRIRRPQRAASAILPRGRERPGEVRERAASGRTTAPDWPEGDPFRWRGCWPCICHDARVFIERVTAPREEFELWDARLRMVTEPPPALVVSVAWESDGEVTCVNVWDSPEAIADFFWSGCDLSSRPRVRRRTSLNDLAKQSARTFGRAARGPQVLPAPQPPRTSARCTAIGDSRFGRVLGCPSLPGPPERPRGPRESCGEAGKRLCTHVPLVLRRPQAALQIVRGSPPPQPPIRRPVLAPVGGMGAVSSSDRPSLLPAASSAHRRAIPVEASMFTG